MTAFRQAVSKPLRAKPEIDSYLRVRQRHCPLCAGARTHAHDNEFARVYDRDERFDEDQTVPWCVAQLAAAQRGATDYSANNQSGLMV